MHSPLPRHPVSCLFLVLVFLAKGLGIRHVTGKRSAVSRMHHGCIHVAAAPRRGRRLWKKLLKMISMRPRFSSKSLKYLRIYSTFHEYPKEPRAVLLCVAESPS